MTTSPSFASLPCAATSAAAAAYYGAPALSAPEVAGATQVLADATLIEPGDGDRRGLDGVLRLLGAAPESGIDGTGGARSRRRPGVRPIENDGDYSKALAGSYLHRQAPTCQYRARSYTVKSQSTRSG